MSVAVVSRTASAVQSAAAALPTPSLELGQKHVGHVCDVSSSVEVDACVTSIESQLGPVDVLLNCAGISVDGLCLRAKDADLAAMAATNLLGPIYLCRAVAKTMMRKKSGHIVLMGSVVGLNGNVGQVGYSATKAGLVGLTRSLAKELGRFNVRVNLVAPGLIASDMTTGVTVAGKGEIPLGSGRVGTPQEVAEAVQLLLGCSYVTGVVLPVDGGLSL
eukprot:gnl/Hemi2/11075_TR3814_c0_g1_i1.p2 gnl/Hemi2/11075_TR3814_c0_g1~~gnl/Hemi2/11075_TR3814_c0_g1_i1.p2  ORF type:complete len:218 (-),score=59.81 gnl/Hemi2/11075_TR3814_c0_g1_i1:97-750(-)